MFSCMQFRDKIEKYSRIFPVGINRIINGDIKKAHLIQVITEPSDIHYESCCYALYIV